MSNMIGRSDAIDLSISIDVDLWRSVSSIQIVIDQDRWIDLGARSVPGILSFIIYSCSTSEQYRIVRRRDIASATHRRRSEVRQRRHRQLHRRRCRSFESTATEESIKTKGLACLTRQGPLASFVLYPSLCCPPLRTFGAEYSFPKP